MLPTKFQVYWPFGSGGVKNGSHLGYPIGMILAIFYLQFIPLLLTKFQVVQEEKEKTDFQDDHLGFPIRIILPIFDLQVTPMLPTKFRVNLFNGLGGVVENVKS